MRSASSVTSPRCQPWSCMPPTPSGFSRLWLGPATKPSSDMDMWQVVNVMLSQTDTSRGTHRRDSFQRCSSDASGLGGFVELAEVVEEFAELVEAFGAELLGP